MLKLLEKVEEKKYCGNININERKILKVDKNINVY